MIAQLSPLAGLALCAALVAVGAYVAAVAGAAAAAFVAGDGAAATRAVVLPAAQAVAFVRRRGVALEHPDRPAWIAGIAAMAGAAAMACAVVPLTRHVVVADAPAAIVVWGAAEAIAIAAVYLQGWSPNSAFALLAGSRYVAIALGSLLSSMFVLIAAALPAQSLSFVDISASQAHVWNVVRQPLGLPLFLFVALAVTSRGPFRLAEGADLGDGTAADASGTLALLAASTRDAFLAAYALAGAVVFLGGWHGPLLPGALWMVVKAVVLLGVLRVASELWARVPASRALAFVWTVALPLGFVDLVVAGIEALA